MKRYVEITEVYAREVLDSRSNPTIEAEIYTSEGVMGSAIVPSGASTGIYEAVELRDGDKKRYFGKGVQNAVKNVNTVIRECILGMNVLNQRAVDMELLKLDGTENKSNLGANAILAVSLAVADAAAKSLGTELYEYIGGANAHVLPLPMMNILNGGAHADNNVDIQEFMIIPSSAKSFGDGLRRSSEVYHSLKNVIKDMGGETAVGDEGGFAPNLENDEKALDLIVEAIEKAGYKPGTDFKIAIDAASTEWAVGNGKYRLPKSGTEKTSAEMADYWENLINKYPITSIEDGMGEEDWDGWKILTEKIGKRVRLVGDDLFVTNTKRLKKGIDLGVANSILIKVNQIGTLTEALDAVETAHKAGYSAVISHRSGETEDTFIADFAVAVNAGAVKTGAPARSERTAKYNRLLRIEDALSFTAEFNTLK